jgi:threonine dehydrogenase-like Zn-dependent dehydrogenase
VPAGIASEHAVFATMAEIALHGVRRSGIGLGCSVVVCGLGLLGQMAARFARLAGARPVLGVDPAGARRARLPADPAVLAVDPRDGAAAGRVREATRGRMADVVIELTGNQHAIPDELRLLRRGGTLAIVSGPRGKTELDFHDLCVSPSLRILGLHNGSHPRQESEWDPWTKSRDVELFFDMVASGDFRVEELISDRLPYSGAPAMYRRLLEDAGPVMGVVLDWTAAGSGAGAA